MAHKYAGGCPHHSAYSDIDPIDSHICHCSVCRRVTGQPTTHVVMFKHADLMVEGSDRLNRAPFNDQNPNGPFELCVCEACGSPIMVEDKQHRLRVIVPNLMGYDAARMPATYHAFYDPAAGNPRPDDRRPVYAGLRPDFVWPEAS